MGVEYRHYLIPRPNTFRPGIDAAVSLITALQEGDWILGSDSPSMAKLAFNQSRLYEPARGHGYFARVVGEQDSFVMPLRPLLADFADRDLMVVWPVESLGNSGLHYPLDPLPFADPADAAECYYEVQLHFGHDFIHHTSDVIDPFEPDPTCSCGHGLEYYPESDEDPFYSPRLSAVCPSCGLAFDPTHLVAGGRDGWTGHACPIQGGATYRFALVVDCGKYFGNRPLRVHSQLKAAVERTLGVHTYELADFY